MAEESKTPTQVVRFEGRARLDTNLLLHIAGEGKNARPDYARPNRPPVILIDNRDGARKRLKELNGLRGGRRNRGQQPHHAIDAIFCGPPPYASPDAWDEERINEWAQASLDWLRETFPNCTIALAALHTDEASPHLHAVMIPESQDHRLAWKRVQREAVGDRKGIPYHHLQNFYYDQVAKGFGLERGEIGSDRKHKKVSREIGLERSREELDVGLEAQAAARKTERRLDGLADLADKALKPDLAAVIRRASVDPERLLEKRVHQNRVRAERMAGPAFKQRIAELQKQEEEAEREADRKIAEHKARVAASKLQAERWDAICRKKPSWFGKPLASAGG